jgi:hypothetical protein
MCPRFGYPICIPCTSELERAPIFSCCPLFQLARPVYRMVRHASAAITYKSDQNRVIAPPADIPASRHFPLTCLRPIQPSGLQRQDLRLSRNAKPEFLFPTNGHLRTSADFWKLP